jgi:hypothetical protein
MGLPLKQRIDGDWANSVLCHGYVAYEVGLWISAPDVIADLGKAVNPALAADAAAKAAKARARIDAVLL